MPRWYSNAGRSFEKGSEIGPGASELRIAVATLEGPVPEATFLPMNALNDGYQTSLPGAIESAEKGGWVKIEV